MSTTRINDDDLASVALYDKVNAIADEIDEEKANNTDFERLDNEAVKLTGDQEIGGAKTFLKRIRFGNTALGKYIEIEALSEKDNTRLGTLRFTNGTDGTSRSVSISCVDNTNTIRQGLNVGIDTNGSLYMKGMTPPASSNGVDIATTAWVKANAPAPTITYLD